MNLYKSAHNHAEWSTDFMVNNPYKLTLSLLVQSKLPTLCIEFS